MALELAERIHATRKYSSAASVHVQLLLLEVSSPRTPAAEWFQNSPVHATNALRCAERVVTPMSAGSQDVDLSDALPDCYDFATAMFGVDGPVPAPLRLMASVICSRSS